MDGCRSTRPGRARRCDRAAAGYAVEAGRDPASIGIECAIRVKRDDDPQKWVDAAEAYRGLGATHLRVMTAGGGYETPARAPRRRDPVAEATRSRTGGRRRS